MAMNEPVAWMELYYGEPNNLSWTDAELRNSGEVYKTIPLYTHPVKEQEIEKLIGNLRNVAEAQGQKGCWDFDQYMLGLFNGLELALSIFEKREPQYRELPPHPVKELTDDEIGQIWKDCMESSYMQVSNPVGFARAILRKASEK